MMRPFAPSAGGSMACNGLKDTGQPDVVHEVMIKRIIVARPIEIGFAAVARVR